MRRLDYGFWLILSGIILLIAGISLFIFKQRINWVVGILLALGVAGMLFGSVLNLELKRKGKEDLFECPLPITMTMDRRYKY
jgi:hypothetical protein